MPHARAYAKRLRALLEKLLFLEVLEEARKNRDLAVPVARGPYFPEARVEGFVELALDVGVVGRVTGSDSEVVIAGGGDADVAVVLLRREELEEEEEEEGEGEEEGDDKTS